LPKSLTRSSLRPTGI